VEDDQAGRLGCGGDQQISDLGAALLTARRQRVLHLDCTVEDMLVHRRQRPRSTLAARTQRPRPVGIAPSRNGTSALLP